jgi:hypothetical protein
VTTVTFEKTMPIRLVVVLLTLAVIAGVSRDVLSLADEFAAAVLVGTHAGVVIFQIFAATGAPVGRLTQGGQKVGALSAKGRQAAAVSAALLAVMIVFLLQKTSLNLSFISAEVLSYGLWSMVFFTFAGAILNGISKSLQECALWTPLLLLNAVLLMQLI